MSWLGEMVLEKGVNRPKVSADMVVYADMVVSCRTLNTHTTIDHSPRAGLDRLKGYPVKQIIPHIRWDWTSKVSGRLISVLFSRSTSDR